MFSFFLFLLFHSCSFIGKLFFFPPQDFLFVFGLLQFVYDMIRCRYCSIYQLHILWASQTFDLESVINFGTFLAIISSTIPSAPFPPYSPSDVAVMHMTHLLILSPREWPRSFFPHSFSLSISVWEVSFDPSSRLLDFPQLSPVYLWVYWRHSSFLLVFLIFSILVYSLDFHFFAYIIHLFLHFAYFYH